MFRATLVVASVVSICRLIAAETPLQIRVFVENAASVTERQITKAETEATAILAQARVAVKWVHCDGKCVDETGTGDFVLALIGDLNNVPVAEAAMGFALPWSGAGNHAAVIVPRVHNQAEMQGGRVHTFQLLAAVMVHELGHLLLREHRHGPGVMTSVFNGAACTKVNQRRLLFTPGQTAKIHRNVTSGQFELARR